MKSLLTWTERRLSRLFRKLSSRQNFHLKAEMFSFHSKYFVYRELKKGASKIEFLFQVSGYWYRPDTGQHTVHFFFESSGLTGSKRFINFENGPLYKTMFHPVFQELQMYLHSEL